jgi:hypothetical protein
VLGLIVPVLNNFQGLAELMASVDYPIRPFVIDNWNGNRGVSAAWNLGMKRAMDAGVTKVVVPGDDVTFYPGTLSAIAETLDRMMFVTPSSLNYENPARSDKEEYVEAPDFSCFACRLPDFIESVGWFDEAFSPAYFEDNDMHWRMRQAGVPGARRLDIFTWHKGSQTQRNSGDNPVVTPASFHRNQMYYVGKWGGIPGEEKFTRPFNDPTKTFKDVVQTN